MCKQHGNGYMFSSGRLGAVSTILFTLWIPWTRFLDCPIMIVLQCVFADLCCLCEVALLPCAYVESHGAATARTLNNCGLSHNGLCHYRICNVPGLYGCQQ